MQGVLGYREVLQNHTTLAHETKPTVHQIKNLINMAKRFSKSPDLKKEKKDELRGIADTWQKFL